MLIYEKKGNILDSNNFIAHCISSDCAMGHGIAVKINYKFNLKKKMYKYRTKHDAIRDIMLLEEYPNVIKIGKVFNLVTKKYCNDLPTYESMSSCLYQLKNLCVILNITRLDIPRMGCCTDKLKWSIVKSLIKDIFKNINITIVVYNI